MVWVKFDDQFPIHRKVKSLTDAQFRLAAEAIFWCNRNTTDGFIGTHELRSVSEISKPERHLAALVSRGLWHEHGQQCASPHCPPIKEGGWTIHDYWDYQPSRSKVLQTRERRAAAGKAGGVRSGESRRGAKKAAKPLARSKPEAKPKQGASHSLEPPTRLLPTEGSEDERAAPLGAPLVPSAVYSPPDGIDLNAVRAQIRDASKAHRNRGGGKTAGAFERLLAEPVPDVEAKGAA